jgi:thioredoxin reductase/polyferredoxin
VIVLDRIKRFVDGILESGTGWTRRPQFDRNHESNVAGLYVIGDLAGAPVIKLAMEQGYEVIEHIASQPDGRGGDPEQLDVVIVGAGASGLNAGLQAKERGLRCVILEKEQVANTIENFPEGKYVYAEPDTVPPKGKLWLDGATKEDLLARWHQIIEDNGLDVRTGEPVTAVQPRPDASAANGFEVKTPKGTHRARRVVIAVGQRGNPRKLGVPGEDREEVYHRLYSPQQYRDEDILVVGGGNSAVEAALVLSERNRVTLSYRGDAFARVFKDNEAKLDEAVQAGRIEVVLASNVRSFGEDRYTLEVTRDGRTAEEERDYRHAFVLIGAELPVKFLKALGIRLENEWTGSLGRSAAVTAGTLGVAWLVHALTVSRLGDAAGYVGLAALLAGAGALVALALRKGDRYAWLGVSFLAWYTVYGAKAASGQEFWPFTGWGYKTLAFLDRPWSFWYTVLYTVLMTVFGLQALRRWGLERKDKFQIWRFVSLLGFQWVLFFLVPEFLFQWAVNYRWVGESLANDPAFADQAWRSYGIVYAWPLFFYTFFYDPHWIWVVWGVFLSFVLIPVFVLFHGKRYCSWICGCGGLAETFGDRWRHLAPKGKTAIAWERMNLWVLAFAVVVTGCMLVKDTIALIAGPTEAALGVYKVFVDVWLVGILPVTLYPFLGGKVWCRYWCPLAKMMGLISGWVGKFKITANDKCIACGECSRYCQVGIDVMRFALKQETLDNANSSCIGCGICVTACPMDVLGFSERRDTPRP